jgi:hypothetical protein
LIVSNCRLPIADFLVVAELCNLKLAIGNWQLKIGNVFAVFAGNLLPQAPVGRCFDYRATQKGRGRLELVNSELTALGPKSKGLTGMHNAGRNSERTGYLVILLFVVGLTAFSSAMKELNQVHELALDASRLIAHWTNKITPAEVPQTVVKLETCENNNVMQSAPAVELPWLAHVADDEPIVAEPVREKVGTMRTVLAQPAKPATVKFDELKKLRIIDPVEFEVRISDEHDAEPDEPRVTSECPLTTLKAKSRKANTIRVNTREGEMFLKTLNRSINFRFAS